MDSNLRKGSAGSSASSEATQGYSTGQSMKKVQISKGEHREYERKRDEKLDMVRNANARLANPYNCELEVLLMYSLGGLSKEEVMSMGEHFAINAGLIDHVDEFRKGALVAQNPKGFYYPFSL